MKVAGETERSGGMTVNQGEGGRRKEGVWPRRYFFMLRYIL